jgi:polysaccharide biosynthesis protein PslE
MAYILTALLRQKIVIVSMFLVIVAITTAFTLLSPKKYEAHMKVLVKRERPEPIVSPDSSSGVVRSEVSEEDVNSEIDLLSNGEVLREVAKRNHLHNGQIEDDGGGSEDLERAVRELRTDLSVGAVRKASIIQVDYASKDPDRAVSVLNTLAELYLEKHLRVHSTAGAQDFFKAQASDYQEQLRTSQERLASLRQRDNVVLLAEQKQLTIHRVMDTESALNDARTALSEAVAHVGTLNRQLMSVKPRVVTQTRVLPNQYLVERLNTMLAELNNQRTALLAKFRPDDRLVVSLDDQIKDTTAALDRAKSATTVEETTDIDPLRQNITLELAKAELSQAGLQARCVALAADLTSWRARLRELDSDTVAYDRLSHEVKLAEDKLDVYVKKQEEARIADALDRQKFANVSIIETPVRPYLPTKPNVPLNLALGFLVACFASLGTGFALETNRNTLDSEEELESALALPVLATIYAKGA